MPKRSMMFNKQSMYFQQFFEDKHETNSMKFWPKVSKQLLDANHTILRIARRRETQPVASLRELKRDRSAHKKHTYEGRIAYQRGEHIHIRLEFIKFKYRDYLIIKTYRYGRLQQIPDS